MICRFCGKELKHLFIDLGESPLANSLLAANQLDVKEEFLPLKLFICDNCFLVQQVEEKDPKQIFKSDYAYFSSYSSSWLEHASNYVNLITEKLELDSDSFVVEIASNDGYLLQYFLDKQIPVLGIEPAENVAEAAKSKGINTLVQFFDASLAETMIDEGKHADLIVCNNVLAHVPAINDFVHGLKKLLKQDGVVTLEFPYLVDLIEQNQFDTIYHEHYSYFSFFSVKQIIEKQGLRIFDVEKLKTHGGSLRLFLCHTEDDSRPDVPGPAQLLKEELEIGINKLDFYSGFDKKVEKVRSSLKDFLLKQSEQGNLVAAYGAAAKGNTLLNYCGINDKLIAFVADASPHKQNKFLPGSHIPVVDESQIKKDKPTYVVILPWNIKEEITQQLEYIREWGGKFVIPVPELEII
ncbi:MAG: class I SAM-dependent methyltransferase [Bacteroidetes bacterium]|nr:class I SAM-dependent methyltransferase [Bacteroidota bacterium]